MISIVWAERRADALKFVEQNNTTPLLIKKSGAEVLEPLPEVILNDEKVKAVYFWDSAGVDPADEELVIKRLLELHSSNEQVFLFFYELGLATELLAELSAAGFHEILTPKIRVWGEEAYTRSDGRVIEPGEILVADWNVRNSLSWLRMGKDPRLVNDQIRKVLVASDNED
jgi:hypothetical protein